MTQEERRKYYLAEMADPVCHEKRLARTRSYYAANKDKVQAYYQTERGKEVRRNATRRFNASAKGIASQKKYQQSGKGKVAAKKYAQTYRAVLRSAHKRAVERHLERWPHDPSSLNPWQVIKLWEKQKGRCALSGITMTWGRGLVMPTSMSTDRIDNTRGYHLDNIRLVCHSVNAFRGNGTDEEMLKIAQALINHKEVQP